MTQEEREDIIKAMAWRAMTCASGRFIDPPEREEALRTTATLILQVIGDNSVPQIESPSLRAWVGSVKERYVDSVEKLANSK